MTPIRQIIAFGLLLIRLLSWCAPLAPAAALAEESLRVGYFHETVPDFSNEDLEISLKLLAEEIGKELNITSSVTVYNDLKLMRRDFEQEKLNFISASSLNIHKDFDQTLFGGGFRGYSDDSSSDTIVVLTRKNSGLDQFAKVQGKRLTLVEYDPVAEMYIDYLSRRNFKKRYRSSFSKVGYEKKSQQAILKLFFGQTDVVCIYLHALRLAAELNPQLEDKLQVVATVDNMPQAVGLFHVNTPADFTDKVVAIATELNRYPRGRQLLELFRSDRFVPVDLEDLKTVNSLYDSLYQMNAP